MALASIFAVGLLALAAPADLQSAPTTVPGVTVTGQQQPKPDLHQVYALAERL